MSGLDIFVRYGVSKKGLKVNSPVSSPQEFPPDTLRS